MIAVSNPRQSNRHVQRLKQAVSQSDKTPTWAVFADDNPVMLRQLTAALDKESAVILPVPQSLWDAADHLLEDAVVWSVEEAAVNTLVIVGNSTACIAQHEPVLAGTTALEEQQDCLLSRVRSFEQKQSQAEKYFSHQVQSLLALPQVSTRLAHGKLTIHCLYYRAESGVFAAYNPVSGAFRALIR